MKVLTVRDIAAVARNRRKQLGFSQAELAAQTGVGREWVSEFEKGKSSVEVGHVVRVLRTLGLSIELQPEITPIDQGVNELEMILDSTRRGAGRA
jgi:y4mF family transcriptional regulator